MQKMKMSRGIRSKFEVLNKYEFKLFNCLNPQIHKPKFLLIFYLNFILLRIFGGEAYLADFVGMRPDDILR